MSSYHHGNLQQVLLEEAKKQLQESGTEKLSLRALARAVGVSQTAPYRHFADKEALLVALMADGFVELDKAIHNATLAAKTANDSLVDAGVAFVHFAAENAECYKLMFSPLLAKKDTYPELKAMATQSLGRLQNIIRQKLQTDNQELIWQATMNATALVHGHARMHIAGMPACNPETGEKLDLRKALEAYALGLS